MKKHSILCALILMVIGFVALPAFSHQAFAQVKLKSVPKPKGKSKMFNTSVTVPSDWIYIYDKKKGYGFSVPGDSVGEASTVKGVDLMTITTPGPKSVDIFVLAFKDKTLTKDDLMDFAIGFLEGLDQKVTEGDIVGESEDYLIVNADTVHPTLGKGKLRILVGTDITDNYIMIVGADDKTFNASEKMIDMIWGSFEMWSGGASGKN